MAPRPADPLPPLKKLERENARLKKLLAEQALDKAILEEALKEEPLSPDRRRQVRSGLQRQAPR